MLYWNSLQGQEPARCAHSKDKVQPRRPSALPDLCSHCMDAELWLPEQCTGALLPTSRQARSKDTGTTTPVRATASLGGQTSPSLTNISIRWDHLAAQHQDLVSGLRGMFPCFGTTFQINLLSLDELGRKAECSWPLPGGTWSCARLSPGRGRNPRWPKGGGQTLCVTQQSRK